MRQLPPRFLIGKNRTAKVAPENGIEVEVLQTKAAVERFNELRESMPVGGLFHSTC
jgi:hypothetical protein